MSDAIASSSPTSRVKIPWLIGIFAAFALFAVIAAYSSRMTNDYTSFDQQRAEARKATLAKVRHDEQALLNPVNPQDPNGPPTAEWIDQDKGTVRIPIEQAMTKELDALQAKPAAMGAPIAGVAAPAPVNPGPANNGTNAPPGSAINITAGVAPSPAKPPAKPKP